MKTLRIDTSNNLVTRIELVVNKITYKLEKKRGKPGDQNVLELIEKLLKKQGVTLKDINAIEVNVGPGSFTGLRVGVAIANTLSFALGIPVNGKPLEEIEIPTY